jgi:hypothetical protein
MLTIVYVHPTVCDVGRQRISFVDSRTSPLSIVAMALSPSELTATLPDEK